MKKRVTLTIKRNGETWTHTTSMTCEHEALMAAAGISKWVREITADWPRLAVRSIWVQLPQQIFGNRNPDGTLPENVTIEVNE